MKKCMTGFVGGMIVFVAFLFLGGCAGSKTYLLHLSYDTSGTPPFLQDARRPVTLAVYQLQDVRPDRLYLGRRVYRDGMVDFFKPDEGTVEEVVTQSVVKIMEKAGFKVTLVKRSLNPEKEDFKDISTDVALGGKIEALWIEAKTGYLTTDTDVRLRFQAVWGLPKERAWVTRMIEGSAQETDRPFYNPRRAETKINEVFQDGLSKLLKDEPLLREKLLKLE
jgi:hypothetical protein